MTHPTPRHKYLRRSVLGSFVIAIFCMVSCNSADVALLMEEYLWEKRVLLIFSPSVTDAHYIAQNAQLSTETSNLKARDVVVWRIINNHHVSVDNRKKPQLGTPPFYTYFGVDPQQFQVILLGKDNEEKLRLDHALTAESLFDRIDAMPMRARELLDEAAQ